MSHVALALVSSLLWVFSGSACVKNTCRSNEDCVGWAYCNPVTNRCELRPDGGVDAGDAGAGDAGDAGDAGNDAAPPCTDHASCPSESAPICDPGTEQCRPCGGAGDDIACAARDSALPVCHAASGRCVECLGSALHCVADPLAPVCDATSLECRACAAGAGGDVECAARDSSTPVCEAMGGACVECTDSALHCEGTPTLPICDAGAFECRGCVEHAECAPPLGGGVCDGATGRCVEESEVIYVDASVCPGPGAGTAGDPFCALGDGVDAVTPGSHVLLVAAGTYAPISVVDMGTVWIIGEAGAEIGTGLNQSIVYVSGAVDLVLEGLRIFDGFGTGYGVECVGNVTIQPSVTLRGCALTNNSGGGVSATSCTVGLDGNTITGNSGGGVSATSCTVGLDGNTISGNPGGGVYLGSSAFTVVNNVIAQNGSPTAPRGGVSIFEPQAGSTFQLNTVVSNDAQSVEGGIVCYQAVSVQSSIVALNTDGDLSSSCTTSYSFTSADGDPGFVGSGDYHLAPGSACIDAADPAALLDHDIDGQTRPLGLGPDIGADEAG